MTAAEAALRKFARAHHARVKDIHFHNPNVGETAFLEARMTKLGHRVTLYAADSLLGIDVRLSERAFAFAMNHPCRICLFDRHLSSLARLLSWPVFVHGSADFGLDEQGIADWIVTEKPLQLIKSLALGSRESLQVYHNQISAVVEPARDLGELIVRLIALGEQLPELPQEAPGTKALEQLPDDLRPLELFFDRWAISDDEERLDRVARARPGEMADLRRVVEPVLPRIDEYLDSLAEPLPECALDLARLAELVAELRAQDT